MKFLLTGDAHGSACPLRPPRTGASPTIYLHGSFNIILYFFVCVWCVPRNTAQVYCNGSVIRIRIQFKDDQLELYIII